MSKFRASLFCAVNAAFCVENPDQEQSNAPKTPIILSNKTLNDVPVGIERPTYNRDDVEIGIVHIGPSAFFRGHLATIVDDMLQDGHKSLGISAISLKTPDVRNALEPQDYLYTVVEQTAEGNRPRIVGSLKEIIVAQETPQKALDRLTSDDTKLVTMTVTQAGYYYKNGTLDFDDPDIVSDLYKTDEATSTVGLLVLALDKRRKENKPPFMVMSCDNMTDNGHILEQVVLAYAERKSPELREYIADNVTFMSTMVDRIVPKTTNENIRMNIDTFGIADNWPIYTEEFRQLVIQDPGKKLAEIGFDKSSATIVDDVAPHELMKIRLLNGTHMVLGMLGRMSGYEHTHEAIRDPSIRTFVTGFMAEMAQTFDPVDSVDVGAYQKTVIQRLENPSMKDELSRLSRNGVDKLSSRFLAPIADAIARDTDIPHLGFAVATWNQYLKASHNGLDILDNKATALGLPQAASNNEYDCRHLVGNSALVGVALANNDKFAAQVQQSSEVYRTAHGNTQSALALFTEAHHGLAPATPLPVIKPAATTRGLRL